MRTLLTALLLTLPAFAAPTVAVNGHLPSPADSARIKALGAVAVRMDFNWFDFQPGAGVFTFAYLDPIVDAARAEGLGIYATIAYTPQWASSEPACVLHSADEAQRCENKRPADRSVWAAAVTAVVTRYRGRVECWGIWNEPNLRGFFDGTLQQFVDDIFLPAAAAIRAADPQAKICGPELAGLTTSSSWNGKNGTCVAGSCIRNGWELDLAQLLDRIGTHLDVITQHTYKADADGVMRALLDGESFGSVLTHDSIRHVIDTHGGAGKDFWLTETGWEHPPQGGTPLADVATRIVALYAKQEEVCAGQYAGSPNDPWPSWRRTYYYHFPYDPGSGWGLLDSAQAPLPPYTALQSWAAGRTTTACLGPAPAVDAGTLDAGSGGGGGGGAGGSGGGGTAGGATAGGATAGGGGGAGSSGGGTSGSAGGSAGGGGAAAPQAGCGCGAPGADGSWALLVVALSAGAARRRSASRWAAAEGARSNRGARCLEADGDSKGCSPLPSAAYVAGNTRERPLGEQLARPRLTTSWERWPWP